MNLFLTALSFSICTEIYQTNIEDLEDERIFSVRIIKNSNNSYTIYQRFSENFDISIDSSDDSFDLTFSEREQEYRERFLNQMTTKSFKEIETFKNNREIQQFYEKRIKNISNEINNIKNKIEIANINQKVKNNDINQKTKKLFIKDNNIENDFDQEIKNIFTEINLMNPLIWSKKGCNVFIGLDKIDFSPIDLNFDNIPDNSKKILKFLADLFYDNLSIFYTRKKIINAVENSAGKFNSLIYIDNGFYKINNKFKEYIEKHGYSKINNFEQFLNDALNEINKNKSDKILE